MRTIYYTKDNETLDYICWRHYVHNNLLEIKYHSLENEIFHSFINNYSNEESGINGIIEQVLMANPGISQYLFIPYGTKLILPDIKDTPMDLSLNDLWK